MQMHITELKNLGVDLEKQAKTKKLKGKKFGDVGDLVFEVTSGELIHLLLRNPTSYTDKMELEKDKNNQILIPFSAVIATGDFIVVAEEDII